MQLIHKLIKIKFFALAIILAIPLFSAGQETKSAVSDSLGYVRIAGPSSVIGELENAENSEALIPAIKVKLTYDDWKAQLKKNHGLSYGLSAAMFYQNANETLPENEHDAFGGIYRFYGSWEILGRGTGHTGRIDWRLEHRSPSFGLQVPQDLGYAVGARALNPAYAWGSMSTDFSVLNYTQIFNNNRAGFKIGRLYNADYMDYYPFKSFYGPFANTAFFINPTMGSTGAGALGAVVKSFITKNVWMGAHIYDANASNGEFDINTIQKGEFMYVGDIGWTPSINGIHKTSIQLLYWYMDPRKSAGVESGQGLTFTASFATENGLTPFLRWGHSDGGAHVYAEDFVSLGTQYKVRKDQYFAIGAGWSKPSMKSYGSGLRDEYVIETSYRVRLTPSLTLMPDVQLLIHPAANPNVNSVWIFGLRLYAHI